MFWPYYYPWQWSPSPIAYHSPVIPPEMPAIKIQELSPQVFPEHSQHNQSNEKFSIPFYINLSKQELINAGYHADKKAWTEEQDQLLKILAESQKDWSKIANSLPGRNQKMCYSRYRRIKQTSRVHWTKLQDQKISEFVQEYGQNWKQINKHFPNRNPKLLKEHYTNHLAPGVDKTVWTVENDLILISLLNQYGRNWRVISEQMPGRTATQLKNRYFGRIKRLMEAKLAKLSLSRNRLNAIQQNESNHEQSS